MATEERKAKQREYLAKWRKNHPEKHKEHCAKWRANNREQDLAAKAKYRKDNKKKIADGFRRHVLKKKYGLSKEEYDCMLEAQGGVCAICKQVCSTGRNLAVDHDHVSGRIRSLLCRDCNITIGLMKEDANRLRAAAEYLEKYAETTLIQTTG